MEWRILYSIHLEYLFCSYTTVETKGQCFSENVGKEMKFTSEQKWAEHRYRLWVFWGELLNYAPVLKSEIHVFALFSKKQKLVKTFETCIIYKRSVEGFYSPLKRVKNN